MARKRNPENADLPPGLYRRTDRSFYWTNLANGTTCSLGTKDKETALQTVAALQAKLDSLGRNTDAEVARALHEGEAWVYERPVWFRSYYARLQRNAAQRGLPFALSLREYEDILAKSGGRCAVSGVLLTWNTPPQWKRPPKTARDPWAPSVDRTDSRRGYDAANCRLVCMAANLALSDWGDQILIHLARHVVARHGVGEVFGRFLKDSEVEHPRGTFPRRYLNDNEKVEPVRRLELLPY